MNELVAQQSDLAVSVGETTETAWLAPEGLSFDEWSAYGRTFQQIHRSINWWLGDWLNAGERRFGEMAMQAVEETGRGVESLLKCKAVSARYAPDARFETLSWSHHLAAAYMDEAYRHDVLAMAATYEISTRDLKTIIAMPVRFLGDLIRYHRDGVRTAEFYRLFELKKIEAIEWDKPLVRLEAAEWEDAIDGDSTYIAPAEEAEAGAVATMETDDEEEEPPRRTQEPDLPFVDLGESDNYDWNLDLSQDIDQVFAFFHAHQVPLKGIYMNEAIWEGLSVRAEIDRDGQPLLVWEVVP